MIQMWTVPKIWEGGTVVIIGGGPSIIKQFEIPQEVVQSVFNRTKQPDAYSPYLEVLHDMHVIGVNMSFLLGPWVDIAFFGDQGFWAKYKSDLLAFRGLRITCAENIEDSRIKILKRINLPHFKKSIGLCQSPDSICWHDNSGASAINLAFHFGVRRIILLGFDMMLDKENNQHWHKYYQGKPEMIHDVMKIHMKGFPAIAEDLKKFGVECINANPDSMLDCFPKMNFKDIVL